MAQSKTLNAANLEALGAAKLAELLMAVSKGYAAAQRQLRFQMAVGAACTSLVGLGGNLALAAAVVLTAAGLVAQVSFWTALQARRRSLQSS
ncbi:hypothetical protein SAMN02745194_04212 [Roseomonas rosea]|uniref:Uncharacterized protein n=1 Tax=Muricoccus roseus TaxID=198092 RepID=A0A1M6PUV3_9PROT|nr:DUF6880 family protein [Roseomonas rosea]SHK11652.1 hypothetical protein SAMN02745194_04212 [Roseomonas rosea]